MTISDRNIFPEQFLKDIATEIRKLNPIIALIFGSSVMRGLHARDIDILIVSDVFENYLWQYRRSILNLPKGFVYDLILLTPGEYLALYDPSHPLFEGVKLAQINLKELMI